MAIMLLRVTILLSVFVSTVFAERIELQVLPAETDPEITINLDPHYVAIDPTLNSTNRLFVFFPGTFASPRDYNLIVNAAADGKYWGNGFRPDSQPNIQRGVWICVEFMLKHNRPGESDGEQAYWIDGELRGHWRGLNWRTSPDLWANAFTLESYVTDRWTTQVENVVGFDNVVIAKKYLGPSGPFTKPVPADQQDSTPMTP